MIDNVYLYVECNDMDAFGEMDVLIFEDRSDAVEYLKHKVEHYFSEPWDKCREIVLEDELNTFEETCVSYFECHWEVKEERVIPEGGNVFDS